MMWLGRDLTQGCGGAKWGLKICALGYGAFSARSDLGGGVSGGIMPSVRLGGYVFILEGPGNLYFRILLCVAAGWVSFGCCSGLSGAPNRRLILVHIGLCPVTCAPDLVVGVNIS